MWLNWLFYSHHQRGDFFRVGSPAKVNWNFQLQQSVVFAKWEHYFHEVDDDADDYNSMIAELIGRRRDMSRNWIANTRYSVCRWMHGKFIASLQGWEEFHTTSPQRYCTLHAGISFLGTFDRKSQLAEGLGKFIAMCGFQWQLADLLEGF